MENLEERLLMFLEKCISLRCTRGVPPEVLCNDLMIVSEPVKCIVPLDYSWFSTGCFNPKDVGLARSLAATKAYKFRKMKAAPAHASTIEVSCDFGNVDGSGTVAVDEFEWARKFWLPFLSQEENDNGVDGRARAPDDDVPTTAILFLYLFGYVDSGGTKTYNSGALDFRDTYVSLLLFHGSYVWIKFRDVAIRRTSYFRHDGVETVRHAPRFKPPREKHYFHVGTYDNIQDAQVAGKIAEFYFGKHEDGTVDLGDGFSFDIPSITAGESGLSSETKRAWIKDKTQTVLETYKTEKAAWVVNLITELLVGPPIVEGSSIRQPDPQDELPHAELNRIGESQQEHRQTAPELNVSEEQPECSRIHEEQQQQHRETLQQLEERNLEIVELEKHLEERDFENFELQRENSQLRQKVKRMEFERDLENLSEN